MTAPTMNRTSALRLPCLIFGKRMHRQQERSTPGRLLKKHT